MGAFLEKPKTDKTTDEGKGCGIRYGVSAMQGWRMEMEDAHVCTTEFNKDWCIFGVFDGHAGSKVSNMCSSKLVETLGKHFKPEGQQACPESNEEIEQALIDAFLELDKELKTSYMEGNDHSGSTAIVVMISPDKIIWANCGDSRGILCRSGKMEFATEDHKPYNVKEKTRIENAGGTVMMQRVNGSLAVSRALGDFDYKRSENLKPEQQLVSPEPEITIMDRNHKDDEFLVLACDGIYDVMSNEDVVRYVRKRLSLEEKLSNVCSCLIDTCLNKNSRDNMSVILVAFPNAPQVNQEAIDEDKEFQKKAKKDIDEELKRMVDNATNQLEVEEGYVTDELAKRFNEDYDIPNRRAYIAERLHVLAKKKFGEMNEMESEHGYPMDDQLLVQAEHQHPFSPFGDQEEEPMLTNNNSSTDDQPPDTT